MADASDDFVITGRIAAGDGPAGGLSVQAFDKSLPSLGAGGEYPLGERAATDATGFYAIRFNRRTLAAARPQLAGKSQLDVFIRVFDGPAAVGDSPVQFGIVSPATIDLVVSLPALSEYETQQRLTQPLLNGVALADLSDDDLQFLRQQIVSRNPGSPRLDALADGISRLALVRRALVESRSSNLPAEVLYGISRILGDKTPVELANLDNTSLKGAIGESIAKRIISSSFAPQTDGLVLQIQRLGYASQVVQLRLINNTSGSPLVGLTLRAISAADPITARVSGTTGTDATGSISFTYLAPPGSDKNPLDFRLTLAPAGQNIPFEQPFTLNPGQPSNAPIDLRVSLPAPPAVPIVSVDRVAAALPTAIPQELQQFLSDRGLTTLSAIRAAGGLARVPGLPVAPDSPAVRTLDAHVDLARLSSNVTLNAALIDKGFNSVTAIADASFPTFSAAASGVLDGAEAAKVHQIARAQTAFLDNLLADAVANPRTAAGVLPADLVRPPSCSCEDCESAISPGFYLADLIKYATASLQQNGKAIDLQLLVDTFHQPFDGLPISCEGVERQVHCARICIEVLRAHLGGRPLADPIQEAALQRAEREYLTKVYTTLLLQIGTTYEELRLARSDTDANRQALATRLGIALTTPRPAGGDELERLLIDVTTGPSGPNGLERSLEALFGLADTFRDPLSDGAKFGDEAAPALLRWSLRGAEWGRNTDPDGYAYVKVQGMEGGSFQITVYRDRGLTVPVASDAAPSPSVDFVVPLSDSGLGGTLEATTFRGAQAVQLSLIPNLLAWRLRQLRTEWATEDRPEDRY